MCKKKLEVLVEPVFRNGKIPEEIKRVTNDVGISGSLKKFAANLVTASTILSEFYLSVQAKSAEPGECSLKLENISIRSIRDKNDTFVTTFGNVKMEKVKISVNCRKKKIEKDYNKGDRSEDNFRIVFPSPGLYWLELEVKETSGEYEIETRQRMLDGKIGTGWSENVKDENNNIKYYFLRQPILVVDSVALSQMRINRSIKALTAIMLIFMVVTQIVQPLEIHFLMKLTLVFGVIVFILAWYFDP